jgi:hypothetical protein
MLQSWSNTLGAAWLRLHGQVFFVKNSLLRASGQLAHSEDDEVEPMQHIQRAMMLTEAPNTNTQNMPLELRQVQKFILYIYMGARGRGREVAAVLLEWQIFSATLG